MKTDNIIGVLTPIFRDVFQNSSLAISKDTVIGDIPLFDDMRFARLIQQTESSFNISLKLKDIKGIHTVEDFIVIIEQQEK